MKHKTHLNSKSYKWTKDKNVNVEDTQIMNLKKNVHLNDFKKLTQSEVLFQFIPKDYVFWIVWNREFPDKLGISRVPWLGTFQFTGIVQNYFI